MFLKGISSSLGMLKHQVVCQERVQVLSNAMEDTNEVGVKEGQRERHFHFHSVPSGSPSLQHPAGQPPQTPTAKHSTSHLPELLSRRAALLVVIVIQ